jgi:hypothetical protein
MTVALNNFVTQVNAPLNDDARAVLVQALSAQTNWVSDHVKQLIGSDPTALTTLANLDVPSRLDPLLRTLTGNDTIKTELLKLLNQGDPPNWLADVVKLLGKDGSVIDAYVKVLTTDGPTGTPGKLAEKLEVVAKTAGPDLTALDKFIGPLAGQQHVRADLVAFLGLNDDWVKDYLKSLATGDQTTGTITAAGTLLANKLNDSANVLAVGALDALLKEIAKKPNVQAELIKVLATDDDWLNSYVLALLKSADSGPRDALAGKLGKIAQGPPPATLNLLIEALLANGVVLGELGKTLRDVKHADRIATLIGVMVGQAPTAADVANFLKDRSVARKAVVNEKTLVALFAVLEQAGGEVTTDKFADLIKNNADAKPLRQALGLPEPTPPPTPAPTPPPPTPPTPSPAPPPSP